MNVLIRQAGSKAPRQATIQRADLNVTRDAIPTGKGQPQSHSCCSLSCPSSSSYLQHFKRFKSRHHLLLLQKSLCRSALERKSRQRLKQCLTKHLRHSIIAPREVPHIERQRKRGRRERNQERWREGKVSAGQSRRWLIKLSTSCRRNKFQKIYVHLFI